MSSESKDELVADLVNEVRAMQGAVDQMDDAAARALGINRTDGRCLDIIDREGPVAAGRLAEAAGLTTAAVTTVIDRLEKHGYAQRLPDPADRRRVLVDMTPLARERALTLWGPLGQFRGELAEYTSEALVILRDFHRRARELNEKRAAEVREISFDDPGPARPPHPRRG